MKISEFRVGAGHTINLGNFNNLKIEASVTVEVNEGDDVDALHTQAQAKLRSMLEETYRTQRKGSNGT
jgi:hypothetical protein